MTRRPLLAATPILLVLLTAVRGSAGLPPDELILVPDFNGFRIMAFSPVDGEPVDPDFLPLQGHVLVPFDVAPGPVGTLLVTAGAFDSIQWYDVTTGEHLGLWAPFGGVDTEVLDAPYGLWHLSVPDVTNVLVAARVGDNANSIVEFSAGGDYLGTRVAPGAGGLEKPAYLVKRGAPHDDLLVTANDTGVVHRYDLDGNPLADFATLSTTLKAVYWHESSNEVWVVGHEGDDEGLHRFDGDGVALSHVDPDGMSLYYGAAPLDNGNILISGLQGVAEIEPDGTLVEMELETAAAPARRLSITIPGLIFRDDFETGDASAWP